MKAFSCSMIMCIALVLLSYSLFGQTAVKIHAHNDYNHAVPFWGALAAGCASIEADVILRNDTLFVAHEVESIKSKRTLESLYLAPMQTSLTLDFDFRPFLLLIDQKTKADATLPKVIQAIEKFPALIEASQKGLITFVISGNRPSPSDYSNFPEFIQFDYQSLDPIDEQIASKVALVSLPYYRLSKWIGKGELPATDQKSLKAIIDKAHAMDKPIRFWAIPDHPNSWDTFFKLGLDYINTDQIINCKAYFNQ